MCDPVTIGIGMLSTVASASAASNAAEAQAESNASLMRYRNQKALNEADWQRQKYAQMQENYYRVGESVQKNARAQYQDALTNIDQTLAATYGRIKQQARLTSQGKASLTSAAAEANVGGLSLTEALQQFELLESENALNESINLKNYITQQYREMQAIQANAQAAANQAQPQPLTPVAAPQPVGMVVGPSPLSAVASGISAAVSYYGATQQPVTAPPPQPPLHGIVI